MSVSSIIHVFTCTPSFIYSFIYLLTSFPKYDYAWVVLLVPFYWHNLLLCSQLELLVGTQSLLIPNIAVWLLQRILKDMYWFAPHLKHPWKTKVDVAHPVTGAVVSRQHVLKRWCLLAPHRVSTLLNSAALRDFTAGLQAKNRKHKCTSLLLVCVCVSHRILVNCGLCEMLQCVWKVAVKLFTNNISPLCLDSVHFPMKMYSDYYVSL